MSRVPLRVADWDNSAPGKAVQNLIVSRPGQLNSSLSRAVHLGCALQNVLAFQLLRWRRSSSRTAALLALLNEVRSSDTIFQIVSFMILG